jgi:large-conductance mechanosensitive channel
MASPSYGIDVVALAFAVILAAAFALLLSNLLPQLAGYL